MDELAYAGHKALLLSLQLCLAPVVVATVVGLVVGLFQTVTQIQEQTLPFGIKLVAVMVCLYLLSSWYGDQLLTYADEMMTLATQRVTNQH